MNKSNLNLAVGESETLTVTINPDDATNKKVNWSSSEPNVVKVDANGKVTAVGVGEASVYITSDYNGERYAYCYVYVEEAVRGDINLDGLIDGRDVIHFMKWLAQEDDVEIVESAADVNKDGKTDEKDLLVLMQYLGGQIEKLP